MFALFLDKGLLAALGTRDVERSPTTGAQSLPFRYRMQTGGTMVAKRAAATAKGTEARLALNISSTVMTRLLISSHSPIFLHIRERFPLSKGQKKKAPPFKVEPLYPRRALASGGEDGIRTHDLRIANATLSQLSHFPISEECALDGLHYTKNRSLCQTLDPLGAQSLP